MASELDVLVVGSNSTTGGIQTYIDQQAEHLDQGANVRVYDTEVPSGSGLAWLVLAVVVTFTDAVRFPLRKRPDVVHVHSAHWFSFYRASFYVLFAGHVWRVPTVLHVHGSSFDEFLESDSVVARSMQRVTFSTCDVVIALSRYWEQQLVEQTCAEHVVVLPNAVDPELFTHSPGAESPRLVFISHLIERKGVRELVEALEQLLEEGESQMRVDIGGSGPLEDSVTALADEHDEITYHGYVSEAEKRRLLSEGSIYLLPSYAEGLPIAILEAMAAGNAVVSTPVGGIPDLIDEESGRLVTVGDGEELASELRSLLERPDTVHEMGEHNRRMIEDRYNWEQVSASLFGLYAHLRDDSIEGTPDDSSTFGEAVDSTEA